MGRYPIYWRKAFSSATGYRSLGGIDRWPERIILQSSW